MDCEVVMLRKLRGGGLIEKTVVPLARLGRGRASGCISNDSNGDALIGGRREEYSGVR